MQSDEMKPPLRFRKLRIAWSVLCAIACVLLIVLWVWSYSGHASPVTWNWDGDHEWSVMHDSGRVYVDHRRLPYLSPEGWLMLENPSTLLRLPYWLLVFTVATFGTLPWLIKRRVSLRTLLIVTTLVAVVLGMAIYAASK